MSVFHLFISYQFRTGFSLQQASLISSDFEVVVDDVDDFDDIIRPPSQPRAECLEYQANH